MPVRLRDFVRAAATANAINLPFVHTTKSSRFLDILRSTSDRALNRSTCPPFTQPLVFLYYGRPAFKLKYQRGWLKGDEINPACFLLRPAALAAPHSVFPFDTGAYELYKSEITDLIDFDEFALYPDMVEALKFATLFYGTERKYLLGNAPGAPIDPARVASCKAASQLLEIYLLARSTSIDDRAFTVEFQYDSAVELTQETIEAVIVPSMLLDKIVHGVPLEEFLRTKLALPDSRILSYLSWAGLTPSQHQTVVMDLALRHLDSKLASPV